MQTTILPTYLNAYDRIKLAKLYLEEVNEKSKLLCDSEDKISKIDHNSLSSSQLSQLTEAVSDISRTAQALNAYIDDLKAEYDELKLMFSN